VAPPAASNKLIATDKSQTTKRQKTRRKKRKKLLALSYLLIFPFRNGMGMFAVPIPIIALSPAISQIVGNDN